MSKEIQTALIETHPGMSGAENLAVHLSKAIKGLARDKKVSESALIKNVIIRIKKGLTTSIHALCNASYGDVLKGGGIIDLSKMKKADLFKLATEMELESNIPDKDVSDMTVAQLIELIKPNL